MSTVTIEARCVRPLVICSHCGPFGPFLDRVAGKAFKAAHSLKHQQERDATAARARRAGDRNLSPASRYDFEDLQ